MWSQFSGWSWMSHTRHRRSSLVTVKICRAIDKDRVWCLEVACGFAARVLIQSVVGLGLRGYCHGRKPKCHKTVGWMRRQNNIRRHRHRHTETLKQRHRETQRDTETRTHRRLLEPPWWFPIFCLFQTGRRKHGGFLEHSSEIKWGCDHRGALLCLFFAQSFTKRRSWPTSKANMKNHATSIFPSWFQREVSRLKVMMTSLHWSEVAASLAEPARPRYVEASAQSIRFLVMRSVAWWLWGSANAQKAAPQKQEQALGFTQTAGDYVFRWEPDW